MNTKNVQHILLIIGFFLALAVSIGAAYYRFFVAREYEITFEYPCEPTEESCYRYQCDGDDCESEGDGAEPYFYRVFSSPASLLPSCDPMAETCSLPTACETAGGECTAIPCEESPDEGISCTDPATFVPDDNLPSETDDGKEMDSVDGMSEGTETLSPPDIISGEGSPEESEMTEQ